MDFMVLICLIDLFVGYCEYFSQFLYKFTITVLFRLGFVRIFGCFLLYCICVSRGCHTSRDGVTTSAVIITTFHCTAIIH
uniref:Uncharacterized protein n=1 Tax=Anopheles darlingi TaxID=43151 RepID=A0A2M4DEB6_ANODA